MPKKILAVALILAFAFSFTAKAVTIEELQQQIQQLQLLLAQLTSQQSQTTRMYCFNTDLKYGMTSNDVKNLQIVLGVTPQTGYFGPKTLAAVKTYQASKGIPTTGYVGPLTRAALNSQYCVPPTTTPPTTAPAETTSTTTVIPSYGSLSVTNYPLTSALTTLYGGQTYEVLAGQFKATGSDITLKKVAVQITHTSGAFPWLYFSSISAWDGSTKVAETAVTQANLIENSFARDYYVVLSGFNWVIPKDQTKVLTIKATIAPVITSSTNFTFAFPTTQVVYSDTAGVTYTSVTGSVSSHTFTIQNAQSASISVTSAIDNPIAGNIIGSTSGTTRADLLKFNIKVENVNATFNSGTITVTASNSSATSYLTAVELWDGSTLLASAAPTWTGTTGSVSWSNFSLPIAAGTTKTLTVKGVFAQLTSGYAGGNYYYVSNGPRLSGIDANSNVASANGSSVTGNNQYLYLVAPTFTLVSATTQGNQGPTSNPLSVASTKIVFQVTANGGDVYINSSTTATYASASPVPSSDVKGFTCTSNATLTSGYWRIAQGSTAICEFNNTLTVSTSTLNGYYQVQVARVGWKTNTSGDDVSQDWGWNNFKTGQVYVAY